jgi:hypothetical protein
VASILAQGGIPSEIFQLVPGRGNLVAQLKGNCAKKPLPTIAHGTEPPNYLQKVPGVIN